MKVLFIHLLLFLSLFARVLEIDISLPQSTGVVDFELGDTLIFSNGMTLECRKVDAQQTESSINWSDIFLAVIDTVSTVTYLNEEPIQDTQWFEDSIWGMYNLSQAPYLNIDASANNCDAWDSLPFPEITGVDSFLLLDTLGDSVKIRKVVPGHFVAFEEDHWTISIVITEYQYTFGDMVYLRKKDQTSALRFRLNELDFIKEDGKLKYYGTKKSLTWEVDSAGNGIFKGKPTSILSGKMTIPALYNHESVQIYNVSGRLIYTASSKCADSYLKKDLPQGVYLLKGIKGIRKIVKP